MIDYFLFDLDGTVTTEELLPRIARKVGIEKEIEGLTKSTIAGEIPFEYSLRHRVALLSKIKVSVVQKIVLDVGLDSNILDFIRNNKERCRIVTGNLDAWVRVLEPLIGVPIISSQVEVSNDKIETVIKVLDKGEAARAFSGNICSIGDGNNDLPMFSASKFGIAYGGVHPPARTLFETATHAIYDGKTLCRFLSQLL